MLTVEASGKSPHLITGMSMSKAPEALIMRDHKLIGELTEPNEILRLRALHIPELLEGGYYLPRNMSIRQMAKKANHGLNYDESYRTYALMNEISENEAKQHIALYHRGYPGIRGTRRGDVATGFHASIVRQLEINRTLTNCFDRKCYFQEAWGNDMFRQAYSFLPQSTTGDMVNEGTLMVMENPEMIDVDVLAQKHDSITLQMPHTDMLRVANICLTIGNDYLCPELNYNGPFKVKTTLKVGKNWGQMIDVDLGQNADSLAAALESAWVKCTSKTSN